MDRIARLSRLLMMFTLCILVYPISSISAMTVDIDGHWAEKQINAWVEEKKIQGYPDGSFRPNKPITRAEFVTLTNKAFNYSNIEEMSFNDIAETDWYFSELSKAKAAGYLNGYEDGTIRPNQPISRQEVASIIFNISELQAPEKLEVINAFKDTDVIPSWSRDAIEAVVKKQMMKGYPDQTFQAKKSITRSEAVVTLDAAMKSKQEKVTYDKAGVYGPESGQQVIDGNVVVTVSGVTLQNMTINGDLILDKAIGEGEAKLKKVTVKGTTVVRGGGSNSILIEDSTLGVMHVDRSNGVVRIEASGTTEIAEANVVSGAKLETKNLSGNGFGQVVVVNASPGAIITLNGNFGQVIINAPNVTVQVASGQVGSFQVGTGATGATVNVASGASVKNMTIDAPVSITGAGTIQTAKLNVKTGVSFETQPKNVIGQPTSPGSSSGGSSGGGGKTDIDYVREAATALTDTEMKNRNLDLQNVATKLILPPSGKSGTGTTISWTTSNSQLVTATGDVYRPSFEQGDQEVLLTATIKRNNAQETKQFRIIVLSNKAELKLVSAKQGDVYEVKALLTASDLYGAEVHLAFDPQKMDVVDGPNEAGKVTISTGSLFRSLPVANEANYTSKQIVFAGSLLGNVTGHHVKDAVLFSFKARLKGNDSTSITLAEEPIFISAKEQRLRLQPQFQDISLGN